MVSSVDDMLSSVDDTVIYAVDMLSSVDTVIYAVDMLSSVDDMVSSVLHKVNVRWKQTPQFVSRSKATECSESPARASKEH